MRLQRVVLLVTGALVCVVAVGATLTGTTAQDTGIDGLITSVYLVLGAPAFATVGIVILIHRPGHRLGRLLLAVGLGLSIASIGPLVLELLTPFRWAIRPVRGVLEFIVEFAGAISILAGSILVMAWFPDGRPASRLGSLIQILCLVFLAAAALSTASPDWAELGGYGIVLATGLYLLAALDLGRRSRAADPRTQAQMRWVLGSAVVMVVLTGLVAGVGMSAGWIWGLWAIASILPAVAVAIAISRHHLYDIDRLISRSIAYVVVTVILVGLFGGLVIGLQWLLSPLTNGETIVVAASTLIVATLFAPLRSRVQAVVDRRFDRAGYDAARTVEAYAGRLRDELDLATLTGDLQRVTASTVQPVATGVWLRTRPQP
jgi:hypothetical protein